MTEPSTGAPSTPTPGGVAPVSSAPSNPSGTPTATTTAPVVPTAGTPEPSTPTPVAPQVDEVRTIPLRTLLSVKDELKSTKAERDQRAQEATALKEQLDLYKAQAQFRPQQNYQQYQQQNYQQQNFQQQQQQNNPRQPVDPNEVFAGLQDSDLLTAGQLKALYPKMAALNANPQSADAITALSNQMQEIRLSLQDKNYKQTITKYLPEIINNNPGLEDLIRSQPSQQQQIQLALSYARMNPRYQQDREAAKKPPAPAETPKPNQPMSLLDELDRLLSNQAKPASPSSTSAASTSQMASRIATMPREEFLALKEKVKSGR